MSQGNVCRCAESLKPLNERKWGVSDWFCNHSAFNGYQWTASDYSKVHCLTCERTWRTKAKYVESLRRLALHPYTGRWVFRKEDQ